MRKCVCIEFATHLINRVCCEFCGWGFTALRLTFKQFNLSRTDQADQVGQVQIKRDKYRSSGSCRREPDRII